MLADNPVHLDKMISAVFANYAHFFGNLHDASRLFSCLLKSCASARKSAPAAKSAANQPTDRRGLFWSHYLMLSLMLHNRHNRMSRGVG